ncbi:MAG: 4Fe-4S dicluster domain-containing protein [Bacteroidetes bacterium]|nr:MAG: 4Fe-4S dicluster domain-containing protein [Bacteroidota bacterium]
MSNNKKYWKNLAELNSENNDVFDKLQNKEFVEEIPVEEFLSDKDNLANSSTTRRDFLKYIGFSTAAATLAACEGPVVKSIPYVVQPKEIIPGVANYYATTIGNGYDFANILIKNREGRPIKVEKNKLAPDSKSANARVHASILDLYDNARLSQPMKNNMPISWFGFEYETKSKLEEISRGSKEIILLTQTFASPSTYKLIEDFKSKYKNVQHISYDSISESSALNAYELRYGIRGLANYDFSKSKVIVSIGADFLGDWQGGGFDCSYAKGRIPSEGIMSRHIQIESNMTLSGANADLRVPSKLNEQKLILLEIYKAIVGKNINVETDISLNPKMKRIVAETIQEIKSGNQGSVVISGIQEQNYQSLVLEINEKLNSHSFLPSKTILTRSSSNEAISKLVSEMNSGNVGAIIMSGVNPVYSMPNSNAFVQGLKNVDLSICFSMKADETAIVSEYVAASNHYLESWGDFELVSGNFSLAQPVIKTLFDTKQFQELLLTWTDNKVTIHDYIKNNWKNNILNSGDWNKALHDGVYYEAAKIKSPTSYSSPKLFKILSDSSSNLYELNIYAKTGMGDGKHANNPWLQEFPDPLTRATWDNYLTVSEYDAKELGLYLEPSTFFNQSSNDANGGLNGKYAIIKLGDKTIKAPVIVQPGQARGTVGLAIGYGRSKGIKSEMMTGVNAYHLYKDYFPVQKVEIIATDEIHEFALIQLQNTLMGRGDIIKETTLEVFNTKSSEVWNNQIMVSLNHIETPVSSPDVDLWQEFDRSIGHHFNLSIDLNACTGCGACVIACHAENNVPVVGKSEIRKSRDMHWLRIDRYYSSEDSFYEDDQKKDNISGLDSSLSSFGELENPSENPQVAFQPIMCQHCNHAPCETVCPVAATSHGRQGQNHMAYNRCVGTRYCANNCPYKVRRFNWFLYNGNDEFDYHMNNDLGRMVINPDVTVRSRGVMEKCSFCIQNTQAVILKAKNEGRPVAAGEFNDTCACASACSSGAMRFGDINEPESEIAKLKNNKRAYHLLDAVGTKPNVVYQVKVRNTKNKV